MPPRRGQQALELSDTASALKTLRTKLTPLANKERRAQLHRLSSLMMCTSAADLREQVPFCHRLPRFAIASEPLSLRYLSTTRVGCSPTSVTFRSSR
eukprot:8567430-Pyramimonas_sp.AAC.1